MQAVIDAAFKIAVGDMGLKPWEFWQLTPAELREMLDGYNRNRIEGCNDRITIAYLTAKLVRAKKMPELEKLLLSGEGEKKQTPEQMAAILKITTAATGGKVVEV